MIQVRTRDLKKALSRIKLHINKRESIPILQCVRIEAKGNELTLGCHSTIRKTWACAYVEGAAASVEDFIRVVPFDDLNKLVRKLKTDFVDIHAEAPAIAPATPEEKPERDSIQIHSGILRLVIMGKPVAEFPSSSQDSWDLTGALECDYNEFVHECRYVLSAASYELPCNYTSAILFSFATDPVAVVGTDGRRLHHSVLKGTKWTESSDGSRYLVPVDAIDAICCLDIKDNPRIKLEFTDDYMLWEIPGVGHATTKLMDIPYPDFQKVIPDTGHIFKLDCSPALEALGPLSVIANNLGGRDMVVVKADSGLELSVKSEGLGNGTATLLCERIATWTEDSGPFHIAFNIDFLADCLRTGAKSCTGEINMSGTIPTEAAKFWTDDHPRVSVLMPVRLPD